MILYYIVGFLGLGFIRTAYCDVQCNGCIQLMASMPLLSDNDVERSMVIHKKNEDEARDAVATLVLMGGIEASEYWGMSRSGMDLRIQHE